MTAKRSAHERFPEVVAAVRVFARDGYRSAHMSDVAREAGLSEAAIYRYVDSKEGLFVLAIRNALLREPLPGAHGAPRAPPRRREPLPGAHGAHGAHRAHGARGCQPGDFPLPAPSLADMIVQARELVAAEVPFGALAEALRAPDTGDPAAELDRILREMFNLEELA